MHDKEMTATEAGVGTNRHLNYKTKSEKKLKLLY